MKRTVGIFACSVGLSSVLTACGSCSKRESKDPPPSVSSANVPSAAVAEALPRCRPAEARLALPGDDVVVGDVAVGEGGLLVGLIRADGATRMGAVLRASTDLTTSNVIDVGPSLGDDPPPSPRWNGPGAYVAYYARRPIDAGARQRELRVARLDDKSVGKVEATVVQQADESTAFDLAWSEGAGLAAWDEDAPPSAGASERTRTPRGFVKVQALGAEGRRRVASPESSDAESPRLIARSGGGFWLGWLARRVEDARYAIESPGESRAFRWVEVVALTATGEPVGPVRRVSSEKGRASSFELVTNDGQLVVMVQDEEASSDGTGGRVVRHTVGDEIEASPIVGGGIGNTLADLVPSSSTEGRWLAWNDTSERAHLIPLGKGLVPGGKPTAEPSLDGARVLAAVSQNVLVSLVGTSNDERNEPPTSTRPELRRFDCLETTEGKGHRL